MTAERSREVLREHPDGCTVAIRVQPGAKKSAIIGFYGEGSESKIKIALQAPAIEGRANEALVEFLAKTFHLSKSSVRIISGESSRSKVCLLCGLKFQAAEGRLETQLDHWMGTA